MKAGVVIRVARPTDHLTAIAEMYAIGLDFTTQRGHQVGKAPTQDHLLVFYLPDQDEWKVSCARMIAAGFQRVPSYNPYWEAQGQTFEDLDGYRVVLQNAAWTL